MGGQDGFKGSDHGPDALRQYNTKRNFSVTSEPAEGGQSTT